MQGKIKTLRINYVSIIIYLAERYNNNQLFVYLFRIFHILSLVLSFGPICNAELNKIGFLLPIILLASLQLHFK